LSQTNNFFDKHSGSPLYKEFTLKNSLLPSELVGLTANDLVRKHLSVTAVIYYVFLATILTILVLLPLITLDVSVKSSGFIRPISETSTIRSLVNGTVDQLYIKENQKVSKGDLLYVIKSAAMDEKVKYLEVRIQELKLFNHDLQNLLQQDIRPTQLQTPYYKQSLLNHAQKIAEAKTIFLKAESNYNRNKKLYDSNVISEAEFEVSLFDFTKAKHNLSQVNEIQKTQWQIELRTLERDLNDYQNQLTQLNKDKEMLLITSPVSGTVQSIVGLYPGSAIFSDQDLAQISPDTSLIVEAYVSPNDIGMLKPKMAVRFHIDAFNYHQWGLVTGEVIDISNDVQIINEKPFFKVKCSLEKDHLSLKNGYKGYLKKGMTLQAGFIITERTLWQLLYDNIDDWINPNAYRS